jgi:hypothetical protein
MSTSTSPTKTMYGPYVGSQLAQVPAGPWLFHEEGNAQAPHKHGMTRAGGGGVEVSARPINQLGISCNPGPYAYRRGGFLMGLRNGSSMGL